MMTSYFHQIPRDIIWSIVQLVEPTYYEKVVAVLAEFYPDLCAERLAEAYRQHWRSNLGSLGSNLTETSYRWMIELDMVDLLTINCPSSTDLLTRLFYVVVQRSRPHCLVVLLPGLDLRTPLLILILSRRLDYLSLLGDHLPPRAEQVFFLQICLDRHLVSCFDLLLDFWKASLSHNQVNYLLAKICDTDDMVSLEICHRVLGNLSYHRADLTELGFRSSPRIQAYLRQHNLAE